MLDVPFYFPKRPIVQNDGMLGPHGARRVRVGLPISRPSIRRKMIDDGHLRRRDRLQQQQTDETNDHYILESLAIARC
jgi:hypothetical protein